MIICGYQVGDNTMGSQHHASQASLAAGTTLVRR